MNKHFLFSILLVLLLTACSNQETAKEEKEERSALSSTDIQKYSATRLMRETAYSGKQSITAMINLENM